MKQVMLVAVCSLVISGCAFPVISTEFDPNARRMSARTGTHFRGQSDLPRSWQDTTVKYADRVWLEDLIDKQRQLSSTQGSPCSSGVRCSGVRP